MLVGACSVQVNEAATNEPAAASYSELCRGLQVTIGSVAELTAENAACAHVKLQRLLHNCNHCSNHSASMSALICSVIAEPGRYKQTYNG